MSPSENTEAFLTKVNAEVQKVYQSSEKWPSGFSRSLARELSMDAKTAKFQKTLYSYVRNYSNFQYPERAKVLAPTRKEIKELESKLASDKVEIPASFYAEAEEVKKAAEAPIFNVKTQIPDSIKEEYISLKMAKPKSDWRALGKDLIRGYQHDNVNLSAIEQSVAKRCKTMMFSYSKEQCQCSGKKASEMVKKHLEKAPMNSPIEVKIMTKSLSGC